jgi:hypothetical protein
MNRRAGLYSGIGRAVRVGVDRLTILPYKTALNMFVASVKFTRRMEMHSLPMIVALNDLEVERRLARKKSTVAVLTTEEWEREQREREEERKLCRLEGQPRD